MSWLRNSGTSLVFVRSINSSNALKNGSWPMSSKHLRNAACGMFLRLSIVQAAGCVTCRLSQVGISPVSKTQRWRDEMKRVEQSKVWNDSHTAVLYPLTICFLFKVNRMILTDDILSRQRIVLTRGTSHSEEAEEELKHKLLLLKQLWGFLTQRAKLSFLPLLLTQEQPLDAL